MIYMNRDFLRKITLLGFHLLGAVLIILMITSIFVGSPIVNYESENAESVRLTPKSTVGVKDGVNEVNQQFEYDLSKVEISNKSLIFYTCHQNIQVYADDRKTAGNTYDGRIVRCGWTVYDHCGVYVCTGR